MIRYLDVRVKRFGRYKNVTRREGLLYYWIRITRLRTKSDRAEARKFYKQCRERGQEYMPNLHWSYVWFYY